MKYFRCILIFSILLLSVLVGAACNGCRVGVSSDSSASVSVSDGSAGGGSDGSESSGGCASYDSGNTGSDGSESSSDSSGAGNAGKVTVRLAVYGDYREAETELCVSFDTPVKNLPVGTERTLYDFAHWTDNLTTLADVGEAVAVDGRTYYAVWKLADDAVLIENDDSKGSVSVLYNPADRLTYATVSAAASVEVPFGSAYAATVSPAFFVLTTDPVTVRVTYSAQSFSVVFVYRDTQGNVQQSVQTLNAGAMPVPPQVPDYRTEDTVYTFVGWDKIVTAVTGQTTYTATYSQSPRQYFVRFHANGGFFADGSDESEVSVLYTQAPVAEEPERDGYEFLGWARTEGASASAVEVPSAPSAGGSGDYFAVWKELPVYGFDTWDGVTVDTELPTLADGYAVHTAAQLAGLAEIVNGGYSFAGESVVLLSDIDLADFAWTPVGTEEHPFLGTFYGSGRTVSRLRLSDSVDRNGGLFGVLGLGATVYDLRIDGFTAQNAALECVGALVGSAVGASVLQVHVQNVQIGALAKMGGLAGAVQGHREGTSKYNYVYTNMLVGQCSVQNAVIETLGGSASAVCFAYAGGFIGYVTDGCLIGENFARGVSVGDVFDSGRRNNYVGGFIGYSGYDLYTWVSEITCNWAAFTKVSGYYYVAGFVYNKSAAMTFNYLYVDENYDFTASGGDVFGQISTDNLYSYCNYLLCDGILRSPSYTADWSCSSKQDFAYTWGYWANYDLPDAWANPNAGIRENDGSLPYLVNNPGTPA